MNSNNVSQDPESLLDWKNITSDNIDPVTALLEQKSATKTDIKRRPKGRPKKSNTPLNQSVNIEDVPVQQLPPPPPVAQPSPEEQMSNMQLLNAIGINPSFKKTRKSSLRFSTEEPVKPQLPGSVSPERLSLLNLYKSYFRPEIAPRHMKPQKIWPESATNEEILAEITELQTLISTTDPASVLSDVWAKSMMLVEASGPAMGLEVAGLSTVAEITSQQENFKDIMRELLIRYPYLRLMAGFGGYPELKLLVYTVTMIREVHSNNVAAALYRDRVRPDKPVPEDLRTPFY